MVHCLVRPTQAIPYRGSERGREGRGREEGERGWERGWWERRERWRERVREGRTYLAPVSLTVTLLALHVGLLLGESHLLPSLDHLTSVSLTVWTVPTHATKNGAHTQYPSLTTRLPRGPAPMVVRGTRCGKPGHSHHTVADWQAGLSLHTHCRHRTCTCDEGCPYSEDSPASSYESLPPPL